MSKSLVRRSTSLLASQLDYVLMDGSGSMLSKWWDSLASLDAFMDVLKTQNLDSHLIVSVFDSTDIDLVQRDETLRDFIPFSQNPLSAHWGATPLYDAINIMGRRLRELNPERASIVIVTDGDDSGTCATTIHQARAVLDWCKAHGWQVTFIGCDFNNAMQASQLGISDNSAVGVQKSLLTDAARSLGEKRVKYGRDGSSMHFTDTEKQQFGGYLAAPGTKP